MWEWEHSGVQRASRACRATMNWPLNWNLISTLLKNLFGLTGTGFEERDLLEDKSIVMTTIKKVQSYFDSIDGPIGNLLEEKKYIILFWVSLRVNEYKQESMLLERANKSIQINKNFSLEGDVYRAVNLIGETVRVTLDFDQNWLNYKKLTLFSREQNRRNFLSNTKFNEVCVLQSTTNPLETKVNFRKWATSWSFSPDVLIIHFFRTLSHHLEFLNRKLVISVIFHASRGSTPKNPNPKYPSPKYPNPKYPKSQNTQGQNTQSPKYPRPKYPKSQNTQDWNNNTN